MTIEELTHCSPEFLKTLTEAQLDEWFKDNLSVTRPEKIIKKGVPAKQVENSVELLKRLVKEGKIDMQLPPELL